MKSVRCSHKTIGVRSLLFVIHMRKLAFVCFAAVFSGSCLSGGSLHPAPSSGSPACHRSIHVPRVDELDATTWDANYANWDAIAARADSCRDLLLTTPEDALALNYVGVDLIRRASPDNSFANESIGYFEKALSTDGNYRDATYNLSLAYLLSGNSAEAVSVLKNLIRRYPRDAVAWSVLGGTYQMAGEFELAAKAYRQAVEIQPKFANAWRAMGFVYAFQLGRLDKAIPALRTAVRIDPAYLGAWIDLKHALQIASRDAEARQVTKQIKWLAPSSPHADPDH